MSAPESMTMGIATGSCTECGAVTFLDLTAGKDHVATGAPVDNTELHARWHETRGNAWLILLGCGCTRWSRTEPRGNPGSAETCKQHPYSTGNWPVAKVEVTAVPLP